MMDDYSRRREHHHHRSIDRARACVAFYPFFFCVTKLEISQKHHKKFFN